MKRPLLTVALFLVAVQFVVSRVTIDQLTAPPISLKERLLEDRLGIEITIETNNDLKRFNIMNVYVGAAFPPCSNIFEIYVDFRDWKKSGITKGKKYSIERNIDIPRVCLSDIGVPLDFVSLCVQVVDLAVMPRGIVGTVLADISIGISIIQWKVDDLELAKIKIGQVSDCFLFKTKEDCLTKEKGCGWCHETNQCLENRPDGKADICKFCHRCSYSLSLNNTQEECLSKRSCGWCLLDQACHPGDDLGPFDKKIKCDAEDTVMLSNVGLSENANPWIFSVEKQNQNDPEIARQMRNDRTKWAFIGIGIGILISVATLVAVVITISVIILKKRRKNPKKVSELRLRFLSNQG